jgi:hypothetical protein
VISVNRLFNLGTGLVGLYLVRKKNKNFNFVFKLMLGKMAVFWVVVWCVIALMMEAQRTSETLVNFYQTTRRYSPEDSHLRTHRRENLRSYLMIGSLRTKLLYSILV